MENNADRNFKDLEDMIRSAKTLKRNHKESSGILIGPSMAPVFESLRFFSFLDNCTVSESASGPNLTARMAS